jgi:hypothetical protein
MHSFLEKYLLEIRNCKTQKKKKRKHNQAPKHAFKYAEMLNYFGTTKAMGIKNK